RFGNPRGFQARFAEPLAALTGDQGPRDLLVQHRNETCVLAVTDPGILVDVDFPADAQQIAATPHSPNKHLPMQNPTITGQDSNMTDTTQKTPDADEQAQTTTETIASAEASCCATEASSEPAKTPAGHSAAEAAPIDAGTESPAVEASAEQPAEPAPEETTEAVSAEPVAEAEPSESQPPAEPEASTETAEDTTPSAPLASTIELIRFADLDLDARLQQAIAELGFEYATPIQSLALPHTLQ